MGIVNAASRPFSVNLLLAQQERDAGAASSLINFTYSVLGSIGMVLITIFADDYIFGLGLLLVLSMLLSFLLWLWLRNSKHNIAQLKRN